MNDYRRRLLMAFRKKKSDIPKDGVYIQDIDGAFWTSEEWNQDNSRANGVAVIDSGHPEGGFVIAKEELSSSVWGTYEKLISNILTTTDESTAKNNYLGKVNTKQIIIQDSPTCEAAIYCNNYIFPNGQNGYLGAAGEWQIAIKNKSKINTCISKIGGTSFAASTYWSSTQSSNKAAWGLDWYNKDMVSGNKKSKIHSRPFTTLKPSKDGVYILGTDNKLYTKDQWSQPNENAVGVAIINSKHPKGGFVIAKEEKNELAWVKGGRVLIPGVVNSTDHLIAETDYKGVENTTSIVAKYGNSTDYAAGYCNNYTFKNGQKGYLPSAGEWKMFNENKSEIVNYLSLIGGSSVTSDLYWTSTQLNSSSAWAINESSNSFTSSSKNNRNWVWSFTTLS